jgi:alpha/beta hydrolase family protein
LRYREGEMVKSRFTAVAIAVVCSAVITEARVTRIEIAKVERVESPSPGAQGAIQTPPYERMSGKFYGELDPADPKNALITDIQFAPRNARGKVEYVGTFSLMKPADLSKASGVLLYSVVNRGNGTASASPEGHISLVSGWQGDVVPTTINQTIQVPRARNQDGSSITGPLIIRIIGQSGTTAALIIPRATPSPYPPATLDTTKATLVSAVSESPTGVKSGLVKIASADWAFATCEKTPFPGTPDPAHICLKSGFNPSLLYELQYTVKDPFVLGVGFAATRDINSFFHHEKQDDAGTPNPVAGAVRWAISEGSSQSGTFLRAFIRLGFNQDENGRIVWEGSNPNIASRVIDMNRRFALPGGAVEFYELGTEAPVWWEDWNDAPRERGKSGLLDRCRTTKTCPKILETFGSSEIWNLRASFMLVGTDAKADIPLPENVRRYFFAGVTHGGGRGGFSSAETAAAGCDLPVNPAPSAPMRAALMKAFVAWVTQGTPMLPSRYPTITDGTLVPDAVAAKGFPRIPGKPSPENLVLPLLDYDLGPHFNYQDASGFLTAAPKVKRSLPQLVVKFDADGNEVAGIKSPLQMAPLGTYTGWNVMASGPLKGQVCGNLGGFIPFAKTKAERLASGDPRPSLEERYRSHGEYVEVVSKAAGKLVHEGYLLQRDADAMIKQAEASDILR